MESGYKFMPTEQFLVGNVLRMRLRGEPLDGVSAHCIREADVYGDDPVRLASLFPPTNQEPCEWFFFSWCKLKSKKKAHQGGRGGGGGRGRGRGDRQEEWRTNRVQKGKKERTVRGAGGIEIGHWRSTQSVKDVIQIVRSNRGVAIGYHQNFEYRDSKKQKSEWLMEEYGILPSLEDAAGDDDKELVICKIYKTPAARRAETKKSVLSPAGAFLIPSSSELPSQHILPQQYYPWPESLQRPPPSFDEPLQPADVLQNWPNPAASSSAGAFLIPSSPELSSQYLSPQQYYPWPESLQPPPLPSDEPLQPADVLQNWPNPTESSPTGAFLIPSSPGLPSQHLSRQQYYPWPESLQPPPTSFNEPLPPEDVLQNWPNPVVSSPAGAFLIPSSPELSSQYLSSQQYYSWPESLQPPPPPSDEPSLPAVVLQNWPNPAAYVYDDRTPVVSHISQSSTAETSEHHVDNGNIVLPPAEQQQPEHAELDATANTYPEDPRLQERSAKRRKILGTFSSLFATAPPHRPTTRRAPMIA